MDLVAGDERATDRHRVVEHDEVSDVTRSDPYVVETEQPALHTTARVDCRCEVEPEAQQLAEHPDRGGHAPGQGPVGKGGPPVAHGDREVPRLGPTIRIVEAGRSDGIGRGRHPPAGRSEGQTDDLVSHVDPVGDQPDDQLRPGQGDRCRARVT